MEINDLNVKGEVSAAEQVKAKALVDIDEIVIEDSDDPDTIPISLPNEKWATIEFRTECAHNSFMEQLCENWFTNDCLDEDCQKAHDIKLSGISNIGYCDKYLKNPQLYDSLCSQNSKLSSP